MSYQRKFEGMVGGHYAEYQDEFSLAKQLKACLKGSRPPMPNGYPKAVYHPKHLHRIPQTALELAEMGGLLSNGVPKILSSELVDGYPLGLYNPLVR
jgi:hypothetical protein